MDILLSKRENQKYTILLIILSDNRYWTISEISNVSGIGIKATQLLISDLKRDIKYKTDLMELIQSNRGVIIEREYKINSYFLKVIYFQNSIPFQFFDELFKEELLTFTRFAEDHFISYSSFFNVIKGLKHWLTLHHVAIPKVGTSLIGDEMQIRNIAFEIYSSVYNYSEWPFQKINEGEIKEHVDSLYRRMGNSLTILENEAFCLFMGVNYQRIKKGHVIKNNDCLKVDKNIGMFYHTYYKYLVGFYKGFSLNSHILENEIVFLCFYIATTPYDYLNRKSKKIEDEKKYLLKKMLSLYKRPMKYCLILTKKFI